MLDLVNLSWFVLKIRHCGSCDDFRSHFCAIFMLVLILVSRRFGSDLFGDSSMSALCLFSQ
jgi:hypothetical protein